MSDTAAHSRGPRSGRRIGWPWLRRAAIELIKRVYALALIAIVLWLSWLALRYLVISLLIVAPPPPAITELPRRLDESALTRERSAFAAVTAVEHARSPLSHYHLLDGWFQPDRFNDCTRSGCHAPLPHSKGKERRAFLNMHATSMHCGVCHLDAREPLNMTWYGLRDGRPAHSPPLLRAYAWLDAEIKPPPSGYTPEHQEDIAGLLREAADAADGEPALTALAQHFTAVRFSSPTFAELVTIAHRTLPRFFRGEYGAKLVLRDPKTEEPMLGHLMDDASGRGPAELPVVVHPGRRETPRTCTDCHRTPGSMVPFASLGYPATRVRALVSDPMLMQAIEHMVQGQPLHLPGFLDGRTPTSAPGSANGGP